MRGFRRIVKGYLFCSSLSSKSSVSLIAWSHSVLSSPNASISYLSFHLARFNYVIAILVCLLVSVISTPAMTAFKARMAVSIPITIPLNFMETLSFGRYCITCPESCKERLI